MPHWKRIIYYTDDPEGVVDQDRLNPKWNGDESVEPQDCNCHVKQGPAF